MIPKRIQISRQRKWKPEGAKVLICDRRSKWGNPYRITKNVGAKFALELYEDYIIQHRKHRLKELLNYDYLACWCPMDKKCHIDILIKLLNELKNK